MAGTRGEEYWVLWCEEYVQLGNEIGKVHGLNVAMAKRRGKDPKSIATVAFRMRERGLLRQDSILPKLTPKADRVLAKIQRERAARVYFTLEVAASNKVEALAEVWDVIQQLESWDDRDGEPFQYKPARIHTLGEEEE